MASYLSLDGGGSKLDAILFASDADGGITLISRAKTAGVNPTVYSAGDIETNIKECYRQLFADFSGEIETMYVVSGSANFYARCLPDNVRVKNIADLGEAYSALACGYARRDGFVAVSGTGSDVFCVRGGETKGVVGGWGAVLGDEGSGVWMARRAVNAAVRYRDGWGEETILADMIRSELKLKSLWGLIDYLYSGAGSGVFYRLGQLLPIAARAADDGDEVARSVFRDGGAMMAEQIHTAVKRFSDDGSETAVDVMICGGAWKSHPLFFDTCTSVLRERDERITLRKPWFDHVMAGPAMYLMNRGREPAQIKAMLEQNFNQYIWRGR